MKNPNVALLQLCSGENVRDNLAQIEQQLKQLPESVKLVVTPENAFLFAESEQYKACAEEEGQGPFQKAALELAVRYDVWLLVGSIPMICKQDKNQLTTSSLLFDNKGVLKARYDKLHLFDVDINDQRGQYLESNTFVYGKHLIVVDTPVGRLGMTICYDLRFPGLYQALRTAGAEILSIPAAFTRLTGEAHWECLLRARAIENQCWVIAPAQVGRHKNNWGTWGHSMVVDPWGDIIAVNPDAVSHLTAYIDNGRTNAIRDKMPVIRHNRFSAILNNE